MPKNITKKEHKIVEITCTECLDTGEIEVNPLGGELYAGTYTVPCPVCRLMPKREFEE